jgi:hypothetical protein
VEVSSSGELYAMNEQQQQLMKYDGGKSVCTDTTSLPRPIYLFTCATQWRDQIFLSGWTTLVNTSLIYLSHQWGSGLKLTVMVRMVGKVFQKRSSLHQPWRFEWD